MEYKTPLKAGIKKHKGTLFGIFVLTLLVSLSFGTVLTVWTNAVSYLRFELERAGFGEMTAWVSNVEEMDGLIGEIMALEEVAHVDAQRLVFSNYTINTQESDSEGQLIPYEMEENRYKFFQEDLKGYQENTMAIAQGDVFVSPSLVSMFGVALGDTIDFAVARNGGTVSLKVKGFYEDPFMGSSMIGMKGFLISPEDHESISNIIQGASIDALARDGAMLHIVQAEESQATVATLNQLLNETTSLPRYTEFIHSGDAIVGFMLVLQNAFSGLLIAFVLVLLVVVLVVLGHSIVSTIASEYVHMGILKTLGYTTKMLRRIQLMQYALPILPAMILGLLLAGSVSDLVNGMTLTTTGVRIPTEIPWVICMGAFLAIALLLGVFIHMKTAKIGDVTPMKAIRGETEGIPFRPDQSQKPMGKHMGISLAVRHVRTGKRAYGSACFVAMLLVFFVSMIGRMDIWLGADGKGMMDAFNPADHDIGVQMFGVHTEVDAQEIVQNYTTITDTYLLAMPSVAVNGIDYTANVISEPERFHILEGRTSTNDNEVVVTEFVAADLGVAIGDTLLVAGDLGEDTYTISGIYACANDMGGNIGLNREGYLKIGQDDPKIWCNHYFLEDPSQKAVITEALNTAFGGDVHIHENTWPGLLGIISAMDGLMTFMYGMVTLFILIITAMTGSKILLAEQRDIGIYKAIGFTDWQLRSSFALRFAMVAILGSILGMGAAVAFADGLVSRVMKFAGISNFSSNPDVATVLFPVALITLLFLVFAYATAGKIKRTDLTVLITE